jgi:hypothetical protein
MALPCDTGTAGSACYTHAANITSAQKIARRHAGSLSVVATPCTGQAACQRRGYRSNHPRTIGRMGVTCRMALPCDTGNTGSARYTHAAKITSARKSRAGMLIACQSWLPLAQGKRRARDAATARIIVVLLADWLKNLKRESVPLVLLGARLTSTQPYRVDIN